MSENETATYKHKEVEKATLEYFDNDKLATSTWIDKYSMRDDDGELLERTPEDMHRRMAREFARIEKKYERKNKDKQLRGLSDHGKKREPLTEERLFELFDNFRYIVPQGSVMQCLGNPHFIGSLSNCVVASETLDSYGGICYTDQQLAHLFKRRCGAGIDISKLRPSGISVSNAAGSTTGAVSFMQRFSNTTREVAQHGRRGALMISLDIRHPEAEQFALIKQDLSQVTGANISLKLSDEFMTAVTENKKYTHRFPIDAEEPKYTKEVKAKELWNTIVQCAWKTAEPGIMFWDRHHFYSPSSIYEQYKNVSTNPCLTGETLIAVADGRNAVSISDLAKENKTFSVYTIKDQKVIISDATAFKTGHKKVLKVVLDDGSSFRCTPDHRIMLRNGKYLEASELKNGQSVMPFNSYVSNDRYRQIASNTGRDRRQYRMIAEHNNMIVDAKNTAIHHANFDSFDDRFENLESMPHRRHRHIHSEKMKGKNNPIFHMKKNGTFDDYKKRNSFYKSDGEDNPRYCGVGNKELVRIVSQWVSEIGCTPSASEYRKFASENSLPLNLGSDFRKPLGGVKGLIKKACQKSGVKFIKNRYELRTLKVMPFYQKKAEKTMALQLQAYIEARDEIGREPTMTEWYRCCEKNSVSKTLTTKYGFQGIDDLRAAASNHKIVSIVEDGEEDVYDINVPETHNFGIITSSEDEKNITTSGIFVHNCGEVPMSHNDSCRLTAINLFSFVEDPYTNHARFDYDKFFDVVYDAQRVMDDLVDLELEAVKKILEKVKSDPEPDSIKFVEVDTWEKLYKTGEEGRRTGLGFTALADTLAALGLKFDSDEALRKTKRIMKAKCNAEFESSIDMAIERGKFVGHDCKTEEKSEFVKMLKREMPELHDRMCRYGRRNISVSTVAPTGSVSLLCRTSSGIEPVYELSYKRRKKVNPNDRNAQVDFIDDSGDKWQEFEVFHPKIHTWMGITGETDIKKSPYWGSAAMDIDWKKRIALQSVIQHYVTHSISSTINLPSDVEPEVVSKIYIEAWKQGLKGITVYRDGARAGVLVSDDTKEESDFRETNAPRRPKRLDTEVLRFNNNKEKWICLVGLYKGRPYEIFTGKSENFVVPNWVERGETVREKENGSSRYDFSYKEKNGADITVENLSSSFNPEFWNYAKLISGVLRHGMPLPYVIDLIANLNLGADHLNTWKAGVARMIKKFIPDGTQAKDRVCPKCGDPDGLVYKEGCLECKSCGKGKCG